MHTLTPSLQDIACYLDVVFGYVDYMIPCRSFAEKGNDDTHPPHSIWLANNEQAAENLLHFAQWANQQHMACYIIPGGVKAHGQASSEHILQMQTLLVDLDTGDIEAKLTMLTHALLQPTLIVESGGMTTEGQKKLHVYWKLTEPAEGEALQRLLQLRHHIALTIGGDAHFKSAHQPIRVAGSIYHKGGKPKAVCIRQYHDVEYDLDDLVELSEALPASSHRTTHHKGEAFLDFNTVAPNTDTILTRIVHEGGEGEHTRFNYIQKVIGHWLACYYDGLISDSQAWERIVGYNTACVAPSFEEKKLKEMVKGLWKVHVGKYGMPEHLRAKESPHTEHILSPVNPRDWKGEPPAREWVIEHWLPRGYVTALYGDGGVGKSLLAQQLMTCLAIGKPFLNITLKPSSVYALMCEDNEDELWRRQCAINKHYGISMNALDNLRFISRVGEDNLLMTFDNNSAGVLTTFFEALHEDVLLHQPDLIVLDTAADLFGGNENNRTQVRQFIQGACAKLARSTNGAVLLCAHPSESGMQKGTGAGGSTAWNNTVRSRWYLKRAEDTSLPKQHRILSRVKSNYAAVGHEEYLEWKDGAFLRLNPIEVSTHITGKKQAELHSMERDRKTHIMIELFKSEALKGNIYTMNQFAEAFEDSANNSHNYGLGSKRSITSRGSIGATKGIFKFFKNAKQYDPTAENSRYGYVCVEGMELKIGETVDSETGEILPDIVTVYPDYYKTTPNGNLLPMQNPKTWIVDTHKNTKTEEENND